MNPFGTRSQAEELAGLLDGAAVAGAYDAPVLALAERLRSAGAVLSEAAAPREEFRGALRTRLLAVAAVQGVGVPVAEVPSVPAGALAAAAGWRSGVRSQRGLGVAAGAMASVVAVTGVAVASQRSLPGDPFYGTKKATEALQLRFADGNVEKGTQHLEFAETRLREVRAIALGREELSAAPAFTLVSSSQALTALGGSAGERVREALTGMDLETRKGSELLEEAFRSSGEAEPLRVLATFARRQAASLQRVLPSLPTEAQARAQESLSLVTVVAQETEMAIRLGTCGDDCDPQGAGPALPTASPEPVPGATAVPTTGPTEASEEPDCECAGPQPEPTDDAPEPSAAPGPSASPSPSKSPAPGPSKSPSPSPSPAPSSILPTRVPLPVPSGLPTIIPTSIPLPPVVIPTGVPLAPPS